MTEIAAIVDSVYACPERRQDLVALLDERHPIYVGCRAGTIARMRGWVLQAFDKVGLPGDAVPYVLEELESGHDPYLVAAAACAIRGGERSPMFGPLVARALGRMRYGDDTLSFQHYGAAVEPGRGTTATRELIAALAWLGPSARDALPTLERARRERPQLAAEIETAVAAIGHSEPVTSCCVPEGLRTRAVARRRSTKALAAVAFEDHAGRRVEYGALVRGRPTVMVFFYTRCDNPWKCSLTISKLAQLQREVHAAEIDVQFAAITYDATHDTPARLHAYGTDRGLVLDDNCRMLRCTAGYEQLDDFLELGVSRTGTIVNRHRIELFVLDRHGRLAWSFTRLEWEPREVIARLRASPSARAVRSLARGALAALPSIGIALVPKCPVCWAAYLNALGIAVLECIPYGLIVPAIMGIVLINLLLAYRNGRRRGFHAGTWLTTAGAVVVLVLGAGLAIPHAATVAIGFGVAGAVVGRLPDRVLSRLSRYRSLRSEASADAANSRVGAAPG